MRSAKLGAPTTIPRGIVVAGDVVIDFMEVALPPIPIADEAGQDWQNYRSSSLVHRCGGALLISELLKTNLESAETGKVVFSYDIQRDEHDHWTVNDVRPERLIRSFASVQQFPSNVSENKPEIFRVATFSGFAGPGEILALPRQIDADLIVLSEMGNGFRNNPGIWPQAITARKRPFIILKSGALCVDKGSKYDENKLLDMLLAHHNDRLLVLANADDLRNDGALISRSISWERTATEFASEIAFNPILRRLARCNNVVVRFGLEGAINYDGKSKKARIVYDPNRAEGDYSLQFGGTMSGYGSIFGASLAADLYNDDVRKSKAAKLESYIRNALVAARRLLRFGLGQDPSELRIQYEEIFSRSAAARQFVSSRVPDPVGGRRKQSGTPSFLDDVERTKLPELAREIVKTGKMSPGLNGIPLGRFGALETIDRSEIESYRIIKNLMREFLLAKKPMRPLSIAVFGQPGSGKSFGVTEIANDLASMKVGNIGKRFTFNVAQFASEKELTAAFHLARDEVLKGEVPILFFDEFDAKFNDKPFHWLQYFLAPMQDGVFKDEKSAHFVGKVILVFAGGIYHSFEKFAEVEKKFVDQKLPDFKSRLRGYVDILSPNPDPSNDQDNSYLVRRAVILRSLLKRKCPHLIDPDTGIVNIDEGVLRAFLDAPKYNHDVRSMEALLDMSMLAGKRRFDSAALPTEEQMKIHVDPREFFKLVSSGSKTKRTLRLPRHARENNRPGKRRNNSWRK